MSKTTLTFQNFNGANNVLSQTSVIALKSLTAAQNPAMAKLIGYKSAGAGK